MSSPLSAAEREEIRSLLLAAAAELRASLDLSASTAQPVSPDSSIGRLTRQDAMLAQQMALETRRRNHSRLQLVDAALRRIDSGGFGLCLRCEEPIALPRLRVRPEASLCVHCAR